MAKRKIVDRWTYKYKGIEPESVESDAEEARRPPVVSERVVEIEVRLVKESDESESAPHPLRSVTFEVFCDEPRFLFAGTDIAALRKAAWAELDAAFRIDWKSWYLVRVSPTSPYSGGMGTGLVFSYESVWRGTAHDGTLLLRDFKPYRRGDPWNISPWPGIFKDEKGNVMACIPATDENRAALEQFEEAVNQMRQRIADYLRPDRIEETLANLAGVRRALAGPSADEG